ncbi:uncharacterized protein ACWYII_030218 isoform 1-T3 [Salvelinus alpinus]|uniref:uncharacterized protein n=1 Tax=Salvelinus sp. IW2-2015 TaxID=2691554 RepID=UPI000CEA7BE2|nr:uncharacterized protein LOC112068800 [Salvelinus alpinus]
MTSWLSGETFQRRDKAAVSYPESSLLGQGSGPAQWPNTSRTVEAIFVELCHKHPAGKMVLGNRVNRWAAILGDYRYNKPMSPMERVTLHQTRDSMTTEREESGPFHAAVRSTSLLPAPSTSSSFQRTERGRLHSVVEQPLVSHCHLYHHLVCLPPPSLFLQSPKTCTALLSPASGPKVSRTTVWRKRKSLGIVREHKPYDGYNCSKCGKPRTCEFGHSMYGTVRFCAATSGSQTVEEWLALMRSQRGVSQGQ